MASFYDVTDGRMTEFKRVLSQAGFTSEDVIRIIKTPELAKKMHEAIAVPRVEALEHIFRRADWSPPSWWRSMEKQVLKANAMWPGAVSDMSLPRFVPRKSTEIPLLHVPRPFDELWETLQSCQGDVGWWPRSFERYEETLRKASAMVYDSEPVWLAFDYAANRGKSPRQVRNQSNLATFEVLSALIQFPDWPKSWLHGYPRPNLSGLTTRSRGNIRLALSFDLYADNVELGWWDADIVDRDWASPTIRIL